MCLRPLYRRVVQLPANAPVHWSAESAAPSSPCGSTLQLSTASWPCARPPARCCDGDCWRDSRRYHAAWIHDHRDRVLWCARAGRACAYIGLSLLHRAPDRLRRQQARALPVSAETYTKSLRELPASRSILYQRGLYPAESFERVSVHGMTMLVASHPGLRTYLDAVLGQLSGKRCVATRRRGVR